MGKTLVVVTKKLEHGNQFSDECKKYVALYNMYIFHLVQLVDFFQTGVRTVSVFITQIIHGGVKVTRWNGFKHDQKYSLSKEQNQWHKSTIVQNSLLSWTIPLYCVFIIPLKWVYRVGQVEHSHA